MARKQRQRSSLACARTQTRRQQGLPPLQFGAALHLGEMFWGNIGAANRLDFTAIGPAVNLVSRVETVAKALNLPIVVSEEFARAYGGPLRSLGTHQLRGLATPHELFAPVLTAASPVA